MSMNRPKVYNFSAGPAMLPLEVMAQIQEHFQGHIGEISVLEKSHRSQEVMALKEQIEKDLRDLLAIPEDFALLLMHGGARAQFAALPLNLVHNHQTADYVVTGHWSQLAAQEAGKVTPVRVHPIDAAQCDQGLETFEAAPNCAYIHYTDNETIDGIEFHRALPETEALWVCDATSSLLSKPIDFSKMACVYASAQKNLGISGVTLVIIRKSLLPLSSSRVPSALNYALNEEKNSMVNTPCVFAWYVMSLILDWIKGQGGLAQMIENARNRSQMLYQALDESPLFVNTVPTHWRSRMNIPFDIKQPDVLEDFLACAQARNLVALKGHRAKGGVRASLYNAMPIEGVKELVACLKAFESRYACSS